MKKSKLISVLQAFDREDLKRFGEFLDSPYFNKNKELVRLYALLRKQAPGFPESRVDRYFIWRQLYPRRAPAESEITTVTQ